MDLSKYDQKEFEIGRSKIFVLLWWLIQGTIFRFSLHNMYQFRRILLKMFGCKVGKKVKVRSSAKFTYPWKVSIGDYSWIGDDVTLYSLDHIKIGANSVVSQKSYLCTGSHNIYDEKFSLKTSPIEIGNSVWIASDCFIFPGVKIGNNCVLSARSTLNKSMCDGWIYNGNPAEKIKKRNNFNEKTSLCN